MIMISWKNKAKKKGNFQNIKIKAFFTVQQKDSLSVQLSNLGIVRSMKKTQQTQPRNKSVYIELGKGLAFY